MANYYNSDRLKMVTADVRHRDAVFHFMKGVDYVFHAAALKQVPNCEFFPMEAIMTNVLGSYNVLDAAVESGVKSMVVLSTDKAAYPINVMGMTKALMERVMIAIARERRSETVLCGTRYGNVMFTRGSVIPYFIDLMRQGRPLTVTRRDMTRFMMSIEESIDLVLYAMLNGKSGDMFVRKAPASKTGDIAEALIKIFNYDKGVEEIGLRPGEKLNETLITEEEMMRAEDRGEYFRIVPEAMDMDYKRYYFEGMKDGNFVHGFDSQNTKIMSLEETVFLLKDLPEIKKVLKTWKK